MGYLVRGGENMRIKELREARGLTRYRVARDSGLDWGRLRDAEEGKAGLRLDSVVKLADVLGVSLDELCGRQWPRPA